MNNEEKLTSEQKIIILKLLDLESKFMDKIDYKAYETQNSPAYAMIDRWISEVLGVGFRKDIYDNREVTEANKAEGIMNKVNCIYDTWFIGDALIDIIYYSASELLNEEIVEDVDIRLKSAWSFFKDLVMQSRNYAILNNAVFPNVPVELVGYEESGVVVDGEMLYRKVFK